MRRYGEQRRVDPAAVARENARLGRIVKYRRPGHRSKLNPNAKKCLEDWFAQHIHNPYPTEDQKSELAMVGNISVEQGKYLSHFRYSHPSQFVSDLLEASCRPIIPTNIVLTIYFLHFYVERVTAVNNFFGNKRMRLKRKAILIKQEKEGAGSLAENGS